MHDYRRALRYKSAKRMQTSLNQATRVGGNRPTADPTCNEAYFAGGPSGALVAAASGDAPSAAPPLDAVEPTLLEAA